MTDFNYLALTLHPVTAVALALSTVIPTFATIYHPSFCGSFNAGTTEIKLKPLFTLQQNASISKCAAVCRTVF